MISLMGFLISDKFSSLCFKKVLETSTRDTDIPEPKKATNSNCSSLIVHRIISVTMHTNGIEAICQCMYELSLLADAPTSWSMLYWNNYSWEDPATYGKPFIIDLCNTLWYIDGHSVADPGGFPRFLETSQNLQHMGWVWSIIMVVVNYYRHNRHTRKHFSNQAPRKDDILNSDDQLMCIVY